MNFKDLENAICNETVLINHHGTERLFVAILNNRLITIRNKFSVVTWSEPEIKDWKIKKPEFKPEELGRMYIHRSTKEIVVKKVADASCWQPITVDEKGNVWSVEDE